MNRIEGETKDGKKWTRQYKASDFPSATLIVREVAAWDAAKFERLTEWLIEQLAKIEVTAGEAPYTWKMRWWDGSRPSKPKRNRHIHPEVMKE